MNKYTVPRTLAIIGAGRVGGCFLFHAIQNELAENYIVIDVNQALANSQIQDNQDALLANLTLSYPQILLGKYRDLNKANIIVITAGRTMKDNETRSDLIKTNGEIISSMAAEIKKINFNGIVIIASNPCDALASIFQKKSGMPPNRVISSGNVIDSARLKFLLSQELKINANEIKIDFIGEHGKTGFVPWSIAQIANKPLLDYYVHQAKLLTKEELQKIESAVIQRGPAINKIKGATEFGIAASLVKICEAFFKKSHTVLPIGVYHEHKKSNFGVYFSEPAVITDGGIKKIIKSNFNKAEQIKYKITHNTIAALVSYFYTEKLT